MRTYVNTFSNVTTKVLTYSHLQSLTQGFGLGPIDQLRSVIWTLEEDQVTAIHEILIFGTFFWTLLTKNPSQNAL